MDDIELKPCPFCGSEAKLILTRHWATPDRLEAWVQCSRYKCWCSTKTYSYMEEAIEAWNTREESEDWHNARLIAAAPEMYEALKTLLERLPIIAGDSRHDALTLAIYEAQNLLARIDGEHEVNNEH